MTAQCHLSSLSFRSLLVAPSNRYPSRQMMPEPTFVESQPALKGLPVAGAEAVVEAVVSPVADAAGPEETALISGVVIAVDADRKLYTECNGSVAARGPPHETATTAPSAIGLGNDVLGYAASQAAAPETRRLTHVLKKSEEAG